MQYILLSLYFIKPNSHQRLLKSGEILKSGEKVAPKKRIFIFIFSLKCRAYVYAVHNGRTVTHDSITTHCQTDLEVVFFI